MQFQYNFVSKTVTELHYLIIPIVLHYIAAIELGFPNSSMDIHNLWKLDFVTVPLFTQVLCTGFTCYRVIHYTAKKNTRWELLNGF